MTRLLTFQKSLVDYYVPFLPLEKEHVKKCAQVEAAKRGGTLTPHQKDRIASNLRYQLSCGLKKQ